MVEQSIGDPARTSWARLLGDHDRIARQCAGLATLARQSDRPADAASIMLLELAICVADHLGVEDQVVDLTLAALHAGSTPQQAAAMSRELDALKCDWTDFIVRWTPSAIAADWPAFGDDADAILSRLSTQVRRENELLYAEALYRGIIAKGLPTLQ